MPAHSNLTRTQTVARGDSRLQAEPGRLERRRLRVRAGRVPARLHAGAGGHLRGELLYGHPRRRQEGTARHPRGSEAKPRGHHRGHRVLRPEGACRARKAARGRPGHRQHGQADAGAPGQRVAGRSARTLRRRRRRAAARASDRSNPCGGQDTGGLRPGLRILHRPQGPGAGTEHPARRDIGADRRSRRQRVQRGRAHRHSARDLRLRSGRDHARGSGAVRFWSGPASSASGYRRFSPRRSPPG